MKLNIKEAEILAVWCEAILQIQHTNSEIIKSKLNINLDSDTHQNFIDQVLTYVLTNVTTFDTDIHKIDKIYSELYYLYDNLKYNNIKEKAETTEAHKMFSGLKEWSQAVESLNKFPEIYEKITLECDFDDVSAKGIQVNLLKDLMQKFVEEENYEACAKIRDKIQSY